MNRDGGAGSGDGRGGACGAFQRRGRSQGGPVVEAGVLEGVGVVLRGDDGFVLRQGRRSLGRRFRRDLGGENMSTGCTRTRAVKRSSRWRPRWLTGDEILR